MNIKSVVLPIWHFIRGLASEFVDKGCQRSAAALTYMTLFALVPLMTVTYSVFLIVPQSDGLAEQLQNWVFSSFVPQTGQEVQSYLSDFSSQARNLTGFGIGMLVVTAYLMLTNIEKTFNTIWGVKQARRGLMGFLLYWAVLSIGPFLLGAGLVVSTYLLSMKLVVHELTQLGMLAPLIRLAQWLMTSAAFTLLFAAVPNCKVPIRFALIGGALTAVCFELLKAVFGYFVANSSFQLIYGAFAFVPLFLLWINFLWMIILGGAVFVRTLAERGYEGNQDKLSDTLALLKCLHVFYEKSKQGMVVNDADCVGKGIGLVHWQTLRELLAKHHWLAVTDSGDYVLCRSLSQTTLWQLICLIKTPVAELTELRYAESYPWLSEFREMQMPHYQGAEATYNITLEALYEKASHSPRQS